MAEFNEFWADVDRCGQRVPEIGRIWAEIARRCAPGCVIGMRWGAGRLAAMRRLCTGGLGGVGVLPWVPAVVCVRLCV